MTWWLSFLNIYMEELGQTMDRGSSQVNMPLDMGLVHGTYLRPNS